MISVFRFIRDSRTRSASCCTLGLLLAATSFAATSSAATSLAAHSENRFGSSRLLATGGVSTIEGAAGGGLTTWSLIAGQGDRDQIGASAFVTRADPTDFSLQSRGVALGLFDRVEASFAQQEFGLGTTVPGHSIRQDVTGVKVRVIGDAVFDQDRALPQIALGAQFKHNRDFSFVPSALGAKRADDVDIYLAATKVWLAGPLGRTVLANAGVRASRANQFGILGFGGDRSDSRRLLPEAAAAVFITDHFLLGAEWRAKPDNLSVFREDNAWDVFAAWLPCKHAALTLAHVKLGTIADKANQSATYLSLQIGL